MRANGIRWAAMCGAVILFGSCGGGGDGASASADGMHTVKGTVKLSMPVDEIPFAYLEDLSDAQDQPTVAGRAVDCSAGFPNTGFDDLRAGAPVTVTDEANKTIATGELGRARLNFDLECVFEFRINVPTARFYGLEIAGRSKVTSSFVDLSADQWAWDLSIGDG